MTRLTGSRRRKTTTTRKREKRDERREKRQVVRDSTSGIEASQDHNDEEKREDRRERREAEDNPQEDARGPRMTPQEVPPEGPTLFLSMPPPVGTSGGFKGRGKRAEKSKKSTCLFCFSARPYELATSSVQHPSCNQ